MRPNERAVKMCLVTYARVSTVKQSDRGQSLIDQERAFARLVERNGWQRVRAYAESASAKSHDARATFQRMIAELGDTAPDLIVVYSLDRFTRNLREGLNELHALRGRGVKLLACDWDDPRPIDMDKDADWAVVVAAFTEAEAERRRIARRMRRSYEGRRERGVVAKNRAPFGLSIVDGHLEPDEHGWIMRDVQKMFISGESLGEIGRWARSVDTAFPPSPFALRHLLKSRDFIDAGLRTPEEHVAIEARFGMLSEFASRRRFVEHEFTGVFRCAKCGRVLCGKIHNGRDAVTCGRTGSWCSTYAADSLRSAWVALLEEIDTDAWADGFGAEAPDETARRVALERRSAEIEQEEADLERRRNAALDLFAGAGGAVRAQVEKMLGAIERDEKALEAARQAVLGELAAPTAQRVDTAAVRAAVRELLHEYADLPLAMRNRLNRLLVQHMGAYPMITREKGKHGAVIAWGEASAICPSLREIVSR